jgi:hypothetical protein
VRSIRRSVRFDSVENEPKDLLMNLFWYWIDEMERIPTSSLANVFAAIAILLTVWSLRITRAAVAAAKDSAAAARDSAESAKIAHDIARAGLELSVGNAQPVFLFEPIFGEVGFLKMSNTGFRVTDLKVYLRESPKPLPPDAMTEKERLLHTAIKREVLARPQFGAVDGAKIDFGTRRYRDGSTVSVIVVFKAVNGEDGERRFPWPDFPDGRPYSPS